jgi:hypothetical protein
MFGRYKIILIGVLALLGLYAASLYNYLLFHAFAERSAILVTCGIFMPAWYCRRFIDKDYLLLLGIACLFIIGADLINTPAYQHGQKKIKGN